jgi:UTP--glucose-1-phosphate uridylyltransferase
MSTAQPSFEPFEVAMRREGLPEVVVDTFRYYFGQLAEGHTGMVPESELRPVDALPDLDSLPEDLDEVGLEALQEAVVIKLNGGLGTSMGLDRAKSLLEVKTGLTFLDIIARQAERDRLPLVLMNSFATRDDTLHALEGYVGLSRGLPLDFVQHKIPKVDAGSLLPAAWPANPSLEWCPPGHGDIYPALVTSGMLAKLLEAGLRYAFVSNSDNLGATVDRRLLGHFAASGAPFMMEVTDRTEADRKGGHLARRRTDGQLLLRELAQCPPEDTDDFQDTSKHRFFNTNSLWLDLRALNEVMTARGHVLGLPMIRNTKTVDPRDPASPKVYQIETAMGSAISVFAGAAAVRVPRRRFAPVKTCSDLLAVRSDAYALGDDWTVASAGGTVAVSLDDRYYRKVDDLDRHFPHGPPSLIDCQRFRIEGDIHFGGEVRVVGEVALVNASGSPAFVPNGAILKGDMHW